MNGRQGKKASKPQTVLDAAQIKRKELQLLRSLASDDAYATQSPLGETALDVFSRRNGVSLRTGSGSIIDAETLVAQGLGQWTTGQVSGRRRLVISEAGQAFLKRTDTEEGVDPFIAQHTLAVHKDVEAQGVTRRVVFDEAESPLAWLSTRRNAKGERLLDPSLFEAGERLRRDLTFAQMIPRTTANWDPSLGGRDGYNAPLTYSETVIAARQRADQALRAVGPEFSGLLLDVCGFLKGLETIEGERQWPRRSAKLVLDLALSALARHYGIETHAEGPSRATVRHWGAADYRPKIA
jgi:hypothetical protein